MVCLQPRRQRLASAASNLDTDTALQLLDFSGNTSGQVASSPNGHRLAIVAAGYSGQVIICDVTPAAESPSPPVD